MTRHGHLSAAEIAFLLGYEESHCFYRAFRAWTRQTHRGCAHLHPDPSAHRPLETEPFP